MGYTEPELNLLLKKLKLELPAPAAEGVYFPGPVAANRSAISRV